MILLALLFVSLGIFADRIETDTECGKTKSCVYFPSGCESGDQNNCTKFASWKRKNISSGGIEIELRGATDSLQEPYIAFAFGTKNEMSDADMYACHENGMVTGAIRGRHDPPTKENNDGIKVGLSRIKNGVLHCSFTRPVSVTKNISDGAKKKFDLDAEPYYVLMAQGTFSNGFVTKHTSAAISEKKINFKSVPTSPPNVTMPTTSTTPTAVSVTVESHNQNNTMHNQNNTRSSSRSRNAVNIMTKLFIFLSLMLNFRV